MIAIILFTCDRPPERKLYALRTLAALYENLQQFGEPFWFHIADDGSEEEYRSELSDWAWGKFERTSVSNSSGSGYGASYNLATQCVHSDCDLILPLEDDWELVRPLNLAPLAELLRAGAFNCIRLGYIGYTDTLQASFEFHDGQHYLRLDPDSPERHVFAGGPRLETAAFERQIGPWPEGRGAGETELEIVARPAARQGVAWPIGLVHPRGDLFSHIGTLKAGSGAEEGSQWPVAVSPP